MPPLLLTIVLLVIIGFAEVLIIIPACPFPRMRLYRMRGADGLKQDIPLYETLSITLCSMIGLIESLMHSMPKVYGSLVLNVNPDTVQFEPTCTIQLCAPCPSPEE